MKQSPTTQHKAMRRIAREVYVADLREGRKNRATTFADRRKEASRKGCRKNHWSE